MTARVARYLLAPRWVFVLVVALATVGASTAVYGNGRVGQLLTQVAGPYEIALGTIPDKPVVGLLHLTLTVSDASSKTPLLDASVTVEGRGPERETSEIGPLSALNSVKDPAFYDISTSVDRVGVWTFTVRVSGDLGDASTDYSIRVREPSPLYGIFTWVTVVLFISVIGLGALPSIRARRRRRNESEQHSGNE